MISGTKNILKNLITLEMANNHMGSLDHGKKMIDEFFDVVKDYREDFNFAWKFQFRDIPTFIHPDYKDRMDISYVKRFTETNLTEEQFLELKKYAESKGFISMCTAFDEKSVERLVKLNFQIAKVASCSSTDWPLLDVIANLNIPIIISTAGTSIEDVDKIVSFFQHRGQHNNNNDNFAIMHCVGEYPTKKNNLELNQIDFLRNRFNTVEVGFSTHEHPEDVDTVKLAVAKGVTMFEKHVAVDTEQFPKNAYSATPQNIKDWLISMKNAMKMCGVLNQRYHFSEKEISDLRQFRRGVFAKRDMKDGEVLDQESVFHAWPNHDDQLLSTNFSKFYKVSLKKKIGKNEPIYFKDINVEDVRSEIWKIVDKVKIFLKQAKIVFPGKNSLEISHHYGLKNFYETGLTMITVVNREYCKKLLISLPGQFHPEQYHKKKEETFVLLYGDLSLNLDGIKKDISVGDVVTITPGIKHSFSTKNGSVVEEISSTHYIDDSFYTDESISLNKDRKTIVTNWTSWDLII